MSNHPTQEGPTIIINIYENGSFSTQYPLENGERDTNNVYLKDTPPEDLGPDVMGHLDPDVVAYRCDILMEADEQVRNRIRDEDIFNSWLMLGVPDGATKESVASMAEDTTEYIETLELAINLLGQDLLL